MYNAEITTNIDIYVFSDIIYYVYTHILINISVVCLSYMYIDNSQFP